MPVVRRGRKPNKGKSATGTRAFAQWKKSGWSTHTLKTSKATKYGKTATVGICVSCSNFAGKWKRHGRRLVLHLERLRFRDLLLNLLHFLKKRHFDLYER